MLSYAADATASLARHRAMALSLEQFLLDLRTFVHRETEMDCSSCDRVCVGWPPESRIRPFGPGTPDASCGSSPRARPRRGPAALLLLAAALSPQTAMAQRTPQPVFTELFAYDPAAPSQLLGKWLISSQLDSKLQPLRVGVVEDRTALVRLPLAPSPAGGSCTRLRCAVRAAIRSTTGAGVEDMSLHCRNIRFSLRRQ